MAQRVRRRQDDHRAARPPDSPLRHRGNRQRQLALQKPRRRSRNTRSPRPGTRGQLRRGDRYRQNPPLKGVKIGRRSGVKFERRLTMVAIPTMDEEAARRPSRERESLVNERSRITNRMKSALARLGIRGFKPHLRKAPERLAGLRTAEGTGLPANVIEEFRRDMARLALVREQISSIEKTRAERLERAPDTGPHAMVRLLARVIGIGIETADMLVREILSRKLRDRRAVARYAGLTGSPDESGLKRREKGLAKAGNARVRRGLIQLAWRFLMFQKDSA